MFEPFLLGMPIAEEPGWNSCRRRMRVGRWSHTSNAAVRISSKGWWSGDDKIFHYNRENNGMTLTLIVRIYQVLSRTFSSENYDTPTWTLKPTFAPSWVDYLRIDMEIPDHSREHLVNPQVVNSSWCKTSGMLMYYLEDILTRGFRDRYRARTIGKNSSGCYWCPYKNVDIEVAKFGTPNFPLESTSWP